MIKLLTSLICSSLLLTGCLTHRASAYPSSDFYDQSFADIGDASYYSDRLHGRSTASGEPSNKGELTGAHKTLKFGTWVEVTNLQNDQSVRIKINDRGPFTPGRIVDLSRAAAEKIDLIGPGHAPVKVTIIDPQN